MNKKVIMILTLLILLIVSLSAIRLIGISIYNIMTTSKHTIQNAEVNNSNVDSVLRVSNANLEEDGSREKQELKVYVININPTLYSITDSTLYPNNEGNHPKVTDWFGHSETALVDELVEDLEYASHGYLDVNIVKTERLNEFPKYTKEFYLNDTTTAKSFDERTYIERSRSKNNSNKGDWYNFVMNKAYEGKYSPTGFTYDYEYLIEKYDLVNKKNAGEFDQVWLCSLDPSDAYEDMMVGRTPYWVNGGTIQKDCSNFIIFSPTFSRRDSSLHALGHAFENIVRRAFNIKNGEQKDYTEKGYDVTNDEQWQKLNLWEKFSLSKFNCTGNYTGAGNVHLPPNAEAAYDYQNPNSVYSNWVDWKDYPNLTGKKELTNYTAWMNQTELDKLQGKNENKSSDRMFMRWWLSLFPHVTGYYDDGHFNNWWKYICSLDFVESISRSDNQNKSITVGTELKVNYQLVYQSTKVESVQSIIEGRNVKISNENTIRFVNGKLLAISPGTSTVTIQHDGHSISYDVKVSGESVTGINLNKTNTEIKEGNTQTLTATILPENATNKNVTWNSSNENVATVNKGIITAISTGKATITATTEDGAKKATCNVTVLEKDIKKIEVKNTPTKTTYIKGEKLDLTGGKIQVTHEDSSTEIIDMKDDTVSVTGYNEQVLGKQTLTVKYKEKTTTFEVEVMNKVTSIVIQTNPAKTIYVKGENLDLTGGKIQITYEDKTTEIIDMKDDNVSVTGYNQQIVGEQIITVEYKEKTTTFKIKVKNDLVKIEIENKPNKTIYFIGENFEKEGMKVVATYEDNTKKEITTYDIVGGGNLTLETASIIIKYTENEITKTVEQKIKVLDKSKEQIVIEGQEEAKTEETQVLKVSLYSQQAICRLSGILQKNEYITGMKLVEQNNWKIRYNSVTGEFDLEKTEGAQKEEILNIEITTSDKEGEGIISLTNVKMITKEAETIKIDDVQNSIEIKNPVVLTEIKITKKPDKLVYIVGEKFDKQGMEISAEYSNGTSKNITNYTYLPSESLTINDNKIVISYTEEGVSREVELEIEVNRVPEKNDNNYDSNTSITSPKNDSDNSNVPGVKNDSTIAKTEIPKAGYKMKIICILIIVISIVSIYLYSFIKKYKKI